MPPKRGIRNVKGRNKTNAPYDNSPPPESPSVEETNVRRSKRKHRNEDQLEMPTTSKQQKKEATHDEQTLKKALSGLEKFIEEKNHEALHNALSSKPVPRPSLVDLFRRCVEQENIECVRVFIRSPYKPSFVLESWEEEGSDHEYPLMRAIENQKVDMVEALTAKPVSAKKQKKIRSGDMPPVIHAVTKGNQQILELLLKAKYNPNAGFHFGCYPLNIAIESEDYPAVKSLLDYGATPALMSPDINETALIRAASHCRYDKEKKQGNEVMRNIIKLLLTYPQVVTCKDAFTLGGETSLFLAAELGDPEVVKMLLDVGASSTQPRYPPDVNARYSYIRSPLMIAMENDNMDVFKLLIDQFAVKANIHSFKEASGSLLDTVLRLSTDAEYVKLMLQAGADPNRTERWPRDQQHSSLHVCAVHHRPDVMDILIAHGGDVTKKDAKGMTPMMRAARSHNCAMILYLLNRNSDDFSAVDKKRKNSFIHLMEGFSLDTHDYHSHQIEGTFACACALLESGCARRARRFIEKMAATNCWVTAERSHVRGELFSDQEKQALLDYYKCPQSLKAYCRKVIRRRLGSSYVSFIKGNADIPLHVQQFLFFE